MLKKSAWWSLAAVLFVTCAYGQPIGIDPVNPHYYVFHGQPTILITSAEHYGAVVNKDFDYIAYLNMLQAHGLNYTRIWTGATIEPMGQYYMGNPIAPKPQYLMEPWARSNQPGYLQGGNKFDLDRWNPAFFTRLRDFIVQAGKRGIVVEICFFNSQYSNRWPLSPLYYDNNIQGVGNCDFKDAQSLKHPELVARQSAYVAKITQEVNQYDNVILEICDEPAAFTPYQEAGPWVGHLLQVVHDTESHLPKKHLVAQEVQGPLGGPIDYSKSPILSIIVGQYMWETPDLEMGGIEGLTYKYDDNKPIELNETVFFPYQYQGDVLADSRAEAWEFMVGGGASFNQLNSVYTPQDPAGNTPENVQDLDEFHILKNFIESFAFDRMRADTGFVVGGVPKGAYCRGMSEPGKQYALYLHHAELDGNRAYIAQPGHYTETLTLTMPGGTYKADWVDPASGYVIDTETFTTQGGDQVFTTPEYTVDIALRIKRVQGKAAGI
jgi:hypothetical protein